MSCEIKWVLNKMSKTEDRNLSIMFVVKVEKARAFYGDISQYQVTPPADLKNMAEYLGLAKVCVKNESRRSGLSAFKALGGSCTIAKYIVKETKCDISQIPYSMLASRELRDGFGQATFFPATDGSHDRGAAWAASRLDQKCVTRMPVGSTENRRCHVEDEGTECTAEKMNYDDYIRMIAEEAKHAERGVVTQDTAWEGYEEAPSRAMQGYSTMADEAVEQLEECPIYVFAQAGVGSLVGGVVGYFANKYKKNPPMMVMAEAEPAAYLYKGAEVVDGEIHIVDGEMPIIMASLYCSELNITSWDILKNHVAALLAVNDDVVRRGMRILAAPFKGDLQVISGESDAATFGALTTIVKDEVHRGLHLELGLNQNSKVSTFSTEGGTDPDRYKAIVWGGELKQVNAGGKIC